MKTKKLTLTAIFIAINVVLSSIIVIPLGPIKAAPMQHLINVLCAVFVGPWFGLAQAFISSILRMIFGTGSFFAFPGSMIGAWLSAYLYKKYNAIWAAALGEIIGTGLIGALVSYPIAHFLLGKPLALLTLITSFSMSSIGGACIGFVVLQILSRRNLLHKEA